LRKAREDARPIRLESDSRDVVRYEIVSLGAQGGCNRGLAPAVLAEKGEGLPVTGHDARVQDEESALVKQQAQSRSEDRETQDPILDPRRRVDDDLTAGSHEEGADLVEDVAGFVA
jgi:hypothetical protein